MNKILINIITLLLAFSSVLILYTTNKSKILNNFNKSENFEKNILKTKSLQNDLESGKIVIFGSSELGNKSHKFIPQNYFNKELNLPITVNGHAGHQSFAILSQLASYQNKKVINNARVVIFLSPGWFHHRWSKGTALESFLEYMYSDMMYKLYFESNVDNYYKTLIGKYIKKHISKMKNPSYIYKNAINYNNFTILDKIIYKDILNNIFSNENIKKVKYQNPKLNFDKLYFEAQDLEAKKVTTNKWGINDSYYTKYIEPYILKKQAPPYAIVPPLLGDNQEFIDFKNLVKILKKYKIKPLFIMQDFNPYIYVQNRESIYPLFKDIKKMIKDNGFAYFDMWSYNKNNYELGTLTDIMHTGELGWVKINQKIIEHFMKDKRDE